MPLIVRPGAIPQAVASKACIIAAPPRRENGPPPGIARSGHPKGCGSWRSVHQVKPSLNPIEAAIHPVNSAINARQCFLGIRGTQLEVRQIVGDPVERRLYTTLAVQDVAQPSSATVPSLHQPSTPSVYGAIIAQALPALHEAAVRPSEHHLIFRPMIRRAESAAVAHAASRSLAGHRSTPLAGCLKHEWILHWDNG